MKKLFFFAFIASILFQSCEVKTAKRNAIVNDSDVIKQTPAPTPEVTTEPTGQTTTPTEIKTVKNASNSSEEIFKNLLVSNAHLFYDEQNEPEDSCSSKIDNSIVLNASNDSLEVKYSLASCESTQNDLETKEVTKSKMENVEGTIKYTCTGGTLNKIAKELIIETKDLDGLFLSHCSNPGVLGVQYSLKLNSSYTVLDSEGKTITEIAYENSLTMANDDGSPCSWNIADGIAKVNTCTKKYIGKCVTAKENGENIGTDNYSRTEIVKYLGIIRTAKVSEAKWYSGGVFEVENDTWKGKITFATNFLDDVAPSYTYSKKDGTEVKSGIITDIENESDKLYAYDGSSVDTAIVISETTETLGVQKEYEIISQLYGKQGDDWILLDVSVMKSNALVYDKLRIKVIYPFGETEELDLYFNITSFYGKI